MEDGSPLVNYAPYPRKSTLSFGCEIEFALATVPISGIDPEPHLGGQIFGMPDWQSACSHIRHTLEGIGIPVEIAESDNDKWKPLSNKSWTLKEDATIMAPDRGTYEWVKVELCSPPCYFTPGSLQQVRIVLEVLSKTYRINCNHSCGLHVLVGNALKEFSDRTIRNLMATIWTFEPQISTMHPQHRRENQEMAPNFRKNSSLSSRVSRDPKKGLEVLLSDRANTILKLVEWTQAGLIGLRGGEDILYPFLQQHIEEAPEQYPLGRLLCKLGMPEFGGMVSYPDC
ncbi:hypothetical protein N431DRAFT_555150 [Stipitochalara longipes BDJ]|nr:hypothetical protein N431DRAFT_555150 [Stipitochalara longipes BDJ]